MIRKTLTRSLLISTAILGLILTSACSNLQQADRQTNFYTLDTARTAVRAPIKPSLTAPTIIVNPPHAASGFDSQRIIYVREMHKLQYFAHSEWIDTPARMIAPLIVSALINSGAFRAVALTPSTAAGDLRLDSEILRLQQEFTQQPNRVRFTLRANLIDNTTRKVIATQEFDASVVVANNDPYSGVVAANHAVQAVLEQLANFCATAAAKQPD